MQNTIKKISLYLIIAALTWLPVQVTLAASFIMPANMTMQSNSASPVIDPSLARLGAQQIENTSPCHMNTHEEDCCSQTSACSQMGHDCNHCVSFVAITPSTQLQISPQHYSIQTFYSHRLTSVASLSAYRPPRKHLQTS